MKTELTLTAPLLKTNGDRRNAIAAAHSRSTLELERDIKENIATSKPAGRTSRLTRIVRKASRRNAGLKLKRTRGGVIAGFNFHRASRAGQPPAIRTGRLINSIRGSRIGPLHSRISVGAEYGLPLDDPNGLNRPFFTSRVELYRPIYFANIRRAMLGRD